MKLTDKQAGNLIMLCVVTLFAVNIPVSKYLLSNGYLSPYGLTLLRMLFGAITFWAASLFMKRERVERRDMLTLFVGGLLGIIFNQGLFIWGLSQTSPVDASIITTSTPLFAMVIAAIFLREPITAKKISGVVIGGLGAIILVLTSHQADANDPSLNGNLAVAGSSLSYATFLVVTRRLTSKYSSITMMKWMFLFSTIIFAPLFYNDLIHAPLLDSQEKTPFLLIGYTLLFATFITYMLIPKAQKKIRPTTISMYNNLQPLMASMIAIIMGQDTFSIEKAISGVVILLGVYLVTASKSKSDVEAETAKK